VQVNGFDLYYRQVGTNTTAVPIVVLHGGPGMSSETFGNSLDFLAVDRRVIYYDQRGSGNSQIKPDPSHYTIDQLVDELEVLRRDVIGADQMILVGHSFGGALAQRYAFAYPDHVEKLVLICSIPANGGMGASGPLVDAFIAAMNVVGGGKAPSDPQEADAWFAQLAYESNLPRLYDPADAELLQNMGYVSYVANREVMRSTFGGDFSENLQQLTVDTLIIYGAADMSYTGEDIATEMHGLLPNSTLVRFDESGHWPYLEEPETFQQVLRDFLQ